MKWIVTGWILFSITATFILTDSLKRQSQDDTTELPWWRTFREKFIHQKPSNVDADKHTSTKKKLGFSRPIIDFEQLKEFYKNKSLSGSSTTTTTTTTEPITLLSSRKPVKIVHWKPHFTPNQVNRQSATSVLNKGHHSQLMMGSHKDNPHRFPFVSGSRHNIWGGVSNSIGIGSSVIPPVSTVSNSYFLTSPFLEASHNRTPSYSHHKSPTVSQQKIPNNKALIAKLLRKIIADRLTEHYNNKLSNR